MNKDKLIAAIEQMQTRDISLSGLLKHFSNELIDGTDDICLDLEREQRCGFPEVIFAAGKSLPHLKKIAKLHIENEQPMFMTRIQHEMQQELLAIHPDFVLVEEAGTLRWNSMKTQHQQPIKIQVISAGNSDYPVAMETIESLKFFNLDYTLVQDVGVAGIHRLFGKVDQLAESDLVIVIAGMEGALPSVIGGLISVPMIAVPTSVGYGTSMNGLAAIMGMLNSCASGITVCNIDNGFGAACAALRMQNAWSWKQA
ncbi:MAG: nickel pincer cofactor biosynthesis protein LarB [Lentisphaeria bacterium]|nr:nickel pincer cofactor biosynthesis protein LarB [Lentisphaeria bacterium]